MCGTWIVDLLHWFGCYPISFPCALTRVGGFWYQPWVVHGITKLKQVLNSLHFEFDDAVARDLLKFSSCSYTGALHMQPWDFSFLQNQNHVRMPALQVLQQRKRKLQRLSPGHLATSCASKRENGLAIIKWRSFVTQLLHRYVLCGTNLIFHLFSLVWIEKTQYHP